VCSKAIINTSILYAKRWAALRHVITSKNKVNITDFVFFWREKTPTPPQPQPPQWAMASSFTRFLDHTQRHTTVGRTPLYEWSATSRDLYLTTHNTHNQQISMHPVEFEPIFSTGERPQTYALDRAATGTGASCITKANLTTYKNGIRRGIDYGQKLWRIVSLGCTC